MATIQLVITFDSSNTNRIKTAFDNATTKTNRIIVGNTIMNMDIAAQGGSETDKQYGQRVLRELGKYYMKASEKDTDKERHAGEVEALDPPDQNVPEDILESS